MPATYNDLYLDARKALKSAGVEQAQLEARELLCFASGKGRAEFLRDLTLYASDGVEKRFRGLLERRLKGEPVAYLIGEWEFYGLTLDITRDVLIPRPDTETLVERGILFARNLPEGARVLDLCAGSGCIGLAIADNCPNTHVILAEWSEDALRVCRQNIRRIGLTRQADPVQVDALEPPPRLLRDFDLILCNPPYIPTLEVGRLDPSVRDYEPHIALDGGEDGLKFYRAVAKKWKRALKSGGKLIFEVGHDQAPAVEYILAENGYQDIQTTLDPGMHWRVVEGSAEPGGIS
ncbi:MAG: peptide chain release factor N(5)-glutamine methyltransferase [Oscillospiraceae bacterium]|jgi:release factor glutamine methyltransferase|nr:peptide chain release factor N(5)-glutamine methyltransferase [Oscillospiraceae bacterium]